MKDQAEEKNVNNIAIIGGGFCGASIAIHQMDKCMELAGNGCEIPSIHIQLIDKNGQFGKGTPYNKNNDESTLNQPTNEMSPFTDKKKRNHFTDWLNAKGYRYEKNGELRAYEGHEFVQRKLYGSYMNELLYQKVDELKASGINVTFETIKTNVADVDYKRGRYTLQSETGGYVTTAKTVIYAMGHRKSSFLSQHESNNRYFSGVCNTANIKTCLSHEMKNTPEEGRSVAIVGTGQSMMDSLVAVLDSGFTGKIHAISRNRVKPWPYIPENYEKDLPDYQLQFFKRGLLKKEKKHSFSNMYRILQEEFKAAKEAGYDIGHVMGKLNFEDYKVTGRDSPKTAKMKNTVYQMCMKVYGNTTSPEKYAHYLKAVKDKQLVFVKGEVKEENVQAHAKGFVISGLSKDQTVDARYLFNGASFDRNPANDPLVQLMMEKNIITQSKKGDLMIGAYHKSYAYLAGMLHTRAKWGVGSFRKNNEDIADKSIRAIVENAPPYNAPPSNVYSMMKVKGKSPSEPVQIPLLKPKAA